MPDFSTAVKALLFTGQIELAMAILLNVGDI